MQYKRIKRFLISIQIILSFISVNLTHIQIDNTCISLKGIETYRPKAGCSSSGKKRARSNSSAMDVDDDFHDVGVHVMSGKQWLYIESMIYLCFA